jgi:MFS family permease
MTHMTNNNELPIRLAWTIWGLGALFYLMGFFHRIAPVVMTAELMQTFELGASGLGNLSAFYFYAYVAMQIPTGILADTWGPRYLLSAGALVAGCGAVIFAVAPDLFWAGLGRFLVGGSVAVAYVGTLKLATNWFPPQYFAMIAGAGLMAGIAGAVFAGVPLRILVDNVGWRPGMLAAAAVTLGIGLLIWLFVRDDPVQLGYKSGRRSAGGQPATPSHPIKNLGAVLRYRNTWLFLLIPGGMVGAVLTFSGLWGVPFLTTHHGLSPRGAAALTTTLMASWALASPIIGRLSDRIGRRKPLYIAGSIAAILCWLLVILVPPLPLPVLVVLYILTGIVSAGFITSFAHAKESVPMYLSGTTAGIVNMGIMLGPTVLQPMVGWILDNNWHGTLGNGVRLYSLEAYRFGFSLMIGWLVLGLILLFFTHETYCRQLD